MVPPIPPPSKLKQMDLGQLQKLCKDTNIDCDGDSTELIRRLKIAALGGQQPVSKTPSPSPPAPQPSRAKASTTKQSSAPRPSPSAPTTKVARSSSGGRSASVRSSSSSPPWMVGRTYVGGDSADFFRLPENMLPDTIWSCPGYEWRGNHLTAKAWQKKNSSWYNIANVVPGGIYLRVNLENPSETPPESDACQEMSTKDLNAQEYANLIGGIMEYEAWNTVKPRKTYLNEKHLNDYKFTYEPTFTFAGVAASGKSGGDETPVMGVSVVQEAIPPDSLNLGNLKASETVMSSLRGIKVYPVGLEKRGLFGRTYEICQSELETLTESRRAELLGMTKTPVIRDLISNAPEGELLIVVSERCHNPDKMQLTYVASALRPALFEVNQDRLRQVPGWEDWESLLPSPREHWYSPTYRYHMIEHLVDAVTDHLKWPKLHRVQNSDIGPSFEELSMPNLMFNSGRTASGIKTAWTSMTKHGPYSLGPIKDEPVRVLHTLVGECSKADERAVEEVMRQVVAELENALGDDKVQVGPECGKILTIGNIAQVFDDVALGPQDMIYTFGCPKLGDGTTPFYDRVKTECFQRAQEVDGELRHPASQWIDLGKPCWTNQKSLLFTVRGVVQGSLSKLGVSPYGLDITDWFTALKGKKKKKPKEIVIMGYDVCHMYKKGVGRVHLAAGMTLRPIPGMESSTTLAFLEPKYERVNRESVAGEVLTNFLPKKDVEGKIVIIHRDGRLTNEEEQFWKDYHANLTDTTTFIVVEVIKQGATPRFYDGGKNVPRGKVLWLNPQMALLTASEIPERTLMGTVKPLELHLALELGDTSMLHDDVWLRSVYESTYLHQGTLFKSPRAPVTTFFSDRVAMRLADDVEGQQAAAARSGCQQWYL